MSILNTTKTTDKYCMIIFPQRLKLTSSPTEDWGPYLECHRTDRYVRREIKDTNVFVISNQNTTRL